MLNNYKSKSNDSSDDEREKSNSSNQSPNKSIDLLSDKSSDIQINTTNLSTIPRQYGPSRVDPKEVDKNTYVQAVDQIENKLKDRELTYISICSITVTKLPLVHKFNKNEPWLKVNIGSNEWKARTFQNGNEKGTQGEFIELGWEFLLPRNENDREDLVIAVCSHNVVLGRYILLAKDFKNIPKIEDSEYFEIKGKIRNALGKAGRIEIICKHGIADRPKRPKRIDTAIDNYTDKSLYAPINFIPNNINNHITQVFTKILTIALSDLLSIHVYELNSPFITAVCGDWGKSTSIITEGGSSAKWFKLNWKILLNKIDIITFYVTSGNDLIGLIGLSMEDFISAEPNADGIVEINRFITNGKEISGKIKVTAQIRYTSNTDITKDPSSNQLNDISLSSKLATPLISPKSPKSPKNDKKIYKFNDYDVDINNLFKVDLNDNKTIDKTTVPVSISNNKKITSIPFRINIVSITATDLKAMHLLVDNSPFINAVCGSWGECTSAINNAGSCAHWFQLNWSFVVNHANSLILTVWTKELPIGRVAIKPNDLLNQIIDNSGNVTIFLKIANKGKVTSGKLKVNCVYEPYIEPNPTESVLKSKISPSNRPLPTIAPIYRNDQIELPLTVTVLGIALVDLKPIHLTKSNSPRVKFACDKQIAATEVKRHSGSAAQWLGLSWKFNIYQGSFITITVTSDDESIGSLEYDAVTFISIPLSPKGLIDLSNSIYDTQQYITGKIRIIFKVSTYNPAINKSTTQVTKIDKNTITQPIYSNIITNDIIFLSESSISINSLEENRLMMLISLHDISINIINQSSIIFNVTSKPVDYWLTISYGQNKEVTKITSPKLHELSFVDFSFIFKLKSTTPLTITVHTWESEPHTVKFSPIVLFNNQTFKNGIFTIQDNIYDGNKAIFKIKLNYIKNIVKDRYNLYHTITYTNQSNENKPSTASNHLAKVPLHVPMKHNTNTTRRNSIPTQNLDVIYEDDDDTNRSDKNDSNLTHNETIGLLRKQNSQTGVELGLGKSNNQNNDNKPHGITPTQFHSTSSHNSSDSQSIISDSKDDNNEEIDYPLDCTIKRIVISNVDNVLLTNITNHNHKSSISHWINNKLANNKVAVSNENVEILLYMTLKTDDWTGESQKMNNNIGVYLSDEDLKCTFVSKQVLLNITINAMRRVTISNQSDPLDIEHYPIGTAVILAEDISDLLPNNLGLIEITKSVSLGYSCTAIFKLQLKLSSTSLANLFTDILNLNPLTNRNNNVSINPTNNDKDNDSDSDSNEDSDMDSIVKNQVFELIDDEKEKIVKPIVPLLSPHRPSDLSITISNSFKTNHLNELDKLSPIAIKSKENQVENDDDDVDKKLYIPRRKSITSPDNNINTNVNESPSDPAQNMQYNSNNLDKDGQSLGQLNYKNLKLSGYKIIIKKISTIDLTTVHRLKANSPLVTLICDEEIYTTTILENSGTSAIWNKISFPFIINKDIDLKVIVSSRGKTIGINTFTFFDLVNGIAIYLTM